MRLDEEHPRLGNLERGELLQRHESAVILDLQFFYERRIGATRAHAYELCLDMLNGLAHFLHRIEQRLPAEHVEIDVEPALPEVGVQCADGPRDRLGIALTGFRRHDRYRVADAVLRMFVGQARDQIGRAHV